jgi:signal transduction histidine kinase
MGKTWTLFWLVLLSNSFVHSQNNKELLLKAFTSSDSSDYYFKKAKSAIQNKADEAEYYFCKNARHTDYGQADSAIYYGEIALRKMKGIKEENKQLYVYNNLAKVLQREGKYKEAIQNLLHGATIAAKQNNSLGLGYCYQNISLNYHDFGDYKRGIYYGKLALERFKMAKPVNVMNDIYALNAIAINFDDWNQPDSALYYHKKILEFKKEIDTSQIGFTYNNIGNTLVKQKKYKEAKTWIETAIKISDLKEQDLQSIFSDYEKATNHLNLAKVYLELNQLDKAQEAFAKSFLFVQKSNSVEKLRDYYQLGYEIEKRQTNYQKALDFKEQYDSVRDSIFKIENAKVIAEAEVKYRVAEKEAKLINAEKQQQKSQFIITVIIIIAFGLLLVSWMIFRNQKLKNKQQEQEFELKTAIKEIETQNQLQEQRLTISRDLHDNIGAQLTFIISSIENLKFAFQPLNEKVLKQLDTISDFTKGTITELRDTIWAMNHENFTFEDLQARIFDFVEKVHTSSETQINIKIAEEVKQKQMTSFTGINIYRILQETINNALKHANASIIKVDFFSADGNLILKIEDNGKGFNIDEIVMGNGLLNLKKRAADIKAEISIDSRLNKGTFITVTIPMV